MNASNLLWSDIYTHNLNSNMSDAIEHLTTKMDWDELELLPVMITGSVSQAGITSVLIKYPNLFIRLKWSLSFGLISICFASVRSHRVKCNPERSSCNQAFRQPSKFRHVFKRLEISNQKNLSFNFPAIMPRYSKNPSRWRYVRRGVGTMLDIAGCREVCSGDTSQGEHQEQPTADLKWTEVQDERWSLSICHYTIDSAVQMRCYTQIGQIPAQHMIFSTGIMLPRLMPTGRFCNVGVLPTTTIDNCLHCLHFL